MNAVVDEDLPLSFTRLLSDQGFTVFDVRNVGLRGVTDEQVFQFAFEKDAVLFTADLGFSLMFLTAKETPKSVVILRFPNEMSTNAINKEVYLLLKELEADDYEEGLIILSPGKIRIRRRRSIN